MAEYYRFYKKSPKREKALPAFEHTRNPPNIDFTSDTFPYIHNDVRSDSRNDGDIEAIQAEAVRHLNALNSNFNRSLLYDLFDGSKYPGGLTDDPTEYTWVDYYILRNRSYLYFTKNRYAKGIVNRLITNVIHTGLKLESTIQHSILGISEDEANELNNNIEAYFEVWAADKEAVSWDKRRNYSQLQEDIYKTCLLSGDCLIVLRQHPTLKLPVIQVIDGSAVQTPANVTIAAGRKVDYGVETNARGEHTAYYVVDTSDPFKTDYIRVPAKGRLSGRRVAWMVYGSKIRVSDTRGMPLLGVMMQALQEIDKYSDAEQRSAIINAILPLFIKKTENKPGTKPLTGGAVRRDTLTTTDGDGGTRTFPVMSQIPGLILEELQQGEEPVSYNTQRPNVSYSKFEQAILASSGWGVGIPPEILFLSFNSNYSASQAANNEFKILLDGIRGHFSDDVDKPIYVEWLLSMSLTDRLKLIGFLESWKNPDRFFEFGAWTSSDWSGAIKPSVKQIEIIKSYTQAIAQGFITRDLASKEIYGRKYTTMIRRLRKENEQLVEAQQPLIKVGLIKPITPGA